MELLLKNNYPQVKIADIEKAILSHKRDNRSEFRQNNTASSLEGTRCRTYFGRPYSPNIPCKCPFHHKPPTQPTSKFYPTKRIKHCRIPKISNSQSHDNQQLTDGICRMDRPNVQKPSTRHKYLKKLDSNHTIASKVENLLQRTANQTGRRQKTQEAGHRKIAPKYMNHFGRESYKYMQVMRFLKRQGYELTEGFQITKVKQLVDQIFQQCVIIQKQRYAGRTPGQLKSNCLLSQLTDAMKSKSKDSNSSSGICSIKNLQKQQKTDELIKGVQSNKFTTQHSISKNQRLFKWRTMHFISLGQFLDDVDDQQIQEIAHADREELFEGLEYIEGEVKDEVTKFMAEGQPPPEYLLEGKTSNFVQKVLEAVEYSKTLQAEQISDKAYRLNGGLDRLRKYESRARAKKRWIRESGNFRNSVELNTQSKGTTVGSTQQKDSTPSQSYLKPQSKMPVKPSANSRRNSRISLSLNSDGLGESQNGNIVSSNTKAQKAGVGASNMYGNRRQSLKYVAKMKKQTQKPSVVIKEDAQEQRKSVESKSRKGNPLKNSSASSSENGHDIVEKQEERWHVRTKKRKKGIHKLENSMTNLASQHVLMDEGRRGSMNDIANVKGYLSPLFDIYQFRQSKLLNEINEHLIDPKLAVFKLKSDDSTMIRTRKIKHLKKFIKEQPFYHSRQLQQRISLFEKHEIITKKSREHYQSQLGNITNQEGTIALDLIKKSLVGGQLIWTDQLKGVTKANENQSYSSGDTERYLKQPMNSSARHNKKIQISIRKQNKQEESRVEPQKNWDLEQSQLKHWQKSMHFRRHRTQANEIPKVRLKENMPDEHAALKALLHNIKARRPDLFELLLKTHPN